jgi:hypothetical protein
MQRRQILLGSLAGYLILCLGAATGVTLPGSHTVKGLNASFAFFAFGGSIEAVIDCPGKKVMIVAHDTTGVFRSTGHGTLVFMQAGEEFSTPWTFDRQNPSSDQVIATVSTQSTSGTWTVHLQEDPSVATSFQVPSGACPSPSATATPTPTPAFAPRRTPTPTPTATPVYAPARTPTPRPTPVCPSQLVYDARAGRCVPIGSNGGLG